MAPRKQTDSMTQQKVFLALKENWRESAESLSQRLDLEKTVVLGALGVLVQAGKVIYDLENRIYRVRVLKKDDLPVDELRFANPQEAEANKLIKEGRVKIVKESTVNQMHQVDAIVLNETLSIVIDGDDRLVKAHCSCNFFRQNNLRKGPCKHILAARMALSVSDNYAG